MRSLPRLSASYLRALLVSPTGQPGPAGRAVRRLPLFAALVAACAKGDNLILPSDGDPAAIVVLTGNDQSGRVGKPLTNPLVVQVTDSKGRPVADATVAFDFTDGSDVVPHEKATDADGTADARLVLGTSVGRQAGQARVVTAQGQQPIAAPFSAMAVSENANEIKAVSGDQQTGPAGSTLANPLEVQVTDAFHNPVPNVPITWTPEGGGGVSSSSVITDDQGKASVARILGPATGQQTTLASSEGLAGSPVTFVHTVVPGSPAGVSIVSGNEQIAPAGTQLPADLVVQLLDEHGNGVGGTDVTWVVAIGGGSVTPQNTVTDPSGRTSAQWTLGDVPGDNRLDAVVSGVGIANFRATATPAPGSLPAAIALNGGNDQSGTVGTTLAIPLSVKVTTGSGGPAGGVTVSWTVSGGGSVSSATSVTNPSGIAQVFRTLGPNPGSHTTTATVPGLAGSPIIFQSTATPGAPSGLFLTTQPSEAARNGVKLDRQPVIQLRDGAGRNLALAGVEVTVAIGEGGGELSGTVKQTTGADGRAVFTDLVISGVPGRRTLAFAAANYTGATSQGVNLAATPTTTTITGDTPDPSAPGAPVLVGFRVTSEAPIPTGTVSVSDGVDSCAGTLANGVGSCSIALRTPGSRTLTASYAGPAGFNPSTDTEGHAVNPPTPNQNPIVDFHWSGCEDLECAFTDASRDPDGRVVSYHWDFGDGGTSEQKDPSHRYVAEGTYDVTLTVTDNDGGTASTMAPVEVHAPPPPDNKKPHAEFQASCPDLTCTFTNQSTDEDGTISGSRWDFGDGSSSNETSPSHTYGTGGEYRVTLTVIDNRGGTDSKDHKVEPKGPPPPPDNKKPHAEFEVSCPDLTCTFTNQSTDEDGTISSTAWNFGDGTSSSETSPTHTYGAGGEFHVTLRVTDDRGATDDKDHDAHPKAPNTPPTAAFNPPSCTAGSSCQFNDGSSDDDGSIASRSWNFGDNGSSSDKDPTHTYGAAGPFTVTLTVTDNDGASNSVSHTVNVSPVPNKPPTAAFDPPTCTVGVACQFTDGSSDSDGNIASRLWNFGDGTSTSNAANPTHTYSSPGNVTVTLTVTDDDNADNSVSHTVTVNPPANKPPTAAFTAPSCTAGESCQFNDGSSDDDGSIASRVWDFGDGTPTSADANPTHTYAGSGDVTVTLTVKDDDGATNSVSHTVSVAAGNQAPVADFEFTCPANDCDFTDTSTDDHGVASWSWSFGDPNSGTDNSSTLQNPSHFFATQGDYTVTLTVTDNQGVGSTLVSKTVTIAQDAVPPTP